jgi:uncharacterized RDD family membrane protein YckC
MNPLASIVKRTLSGLIDGFLLILISLSFFAFVAIPVVNEYVGGNNLTTELSRFQLDSFLFYENDQGFILPISKDQMPEGIFRFYVESNINGNQITKDTYYEQILNRDQVNCLFDFSQPINDLTPWLVQPKISAIEQTEPFYLAAYQVAILNLESMPEIKMINDQLNRRLLGALSISFFLIGILLYITIPLTFIKQSTIGQKIFGLYLVDIQGEKPKQIQIIVKGLTTILFLVLGLFLLIPFFSYILMIFHPKRISIPDFFAVTLVLQKNR